MPWRLRSDEKRMDRLQAAAKKRGDGVVDGAVGGGGIGGGGGTALLQMSSDVLFTERTVHGNSAIEIDGEEMAEAEAATVADEKKFCLR